MHSHMACMLQIMGPRAPYGAYVIRELRLREEIQRVGVVGAGAMGRGIAQVCALAGCSVQLFDANEDAVSGGTGLGGKTLLSALAGGRFLRVDANAALKGGARPDLLADWGGGDVAGE